eukprot:11200183-Lingulodinium_polyedra.AAC.1
MCSTIPNLQRARVRPVARSGTRQPSRAGASDDLCCILKRVKPSLSSSDSEKPVKANVEHLKITPGSLPCPE